MVISDFSKIIFIDISERKRKILTKFYFRFYASENFQVLVDKYMELLIPISIFGNDKKFKFDWKDGKVEFGGSRETQRPKTP